MRLTCAVARSSSATFRRVKSCMQQAWRHGFYAARSVALREVQRIAHSTHDTRQRRRPGAFPRDWAEYVSSGVEGAAAFGWAALLGLRPAFCQKVSH